MNNLVSISVVFVASALAIGCAATQSAGAGSLSAPRGSIVSRARTVKAIALGPRVIHTFSGQTGGDLFVAPAITGSDADCEAVSTDDARRPVRIVPDQRAVLSLDDGEVACLATADTRTFELLWHGTGEGRPRVQVASVSTIAR